LLREGDGRPQNSASLLFHLVSTDKQTKTRRDNNKNSAARVKTQIINLKSRRLYLFDLASLNCSANFNNPSE